MTQVLPKKFPAANIFYHAASLVLFLIIRYDASMKRVFPKGAFLHFDNKDCEVIHMYSFKNDYSEGAHPRILQALMDSNLQQCAGYGEDVFCQKAAALIRQKCAAPNAEVHFVSGGTQANMLALHAPLRSFEAVISAHTGHINVHEAGAIEATSHKVCSINSPSSKLTPDMVRSVHSEHVTEMMVAPKIVYISNATEMGAIYTKTELSALRVCCDELGLYLYLDGARLGSALAASNGDLTLADIAALTDAFTIGGTKNGAIIGEAIVLTNPALQAQFRWHMKQRGAILAKGRLLGVMYQAALENGLYFDVARHANEQAARLRDGIMALGYTFPVPSPSNQQFALLPKGVVNYLKEKGYEFETERSGEEEDLIRFVTSWATPAAAIDTFLQDLAAYK